MVKKILLTVLVIVIIVQFIQPAQNISDKQPVADITKLYKVPDNVQQLLKTACYDCHNNNTIYPWYSHIQPVAWFMANHINDGKAKLNFNEFGTYKKRRQISKLKEIANQIKDDEMPISSYKLMHKNANLTGGQKALITDWMDKTADSLSNNK